MPTIATKKPTTMFVTKRLVKEAATSMGPLRLVDKAQGTLGVLIVFESKEAAEMWHGIGVETFEIELVC